MLTKTIIGCVLYVAIAITPALAQSTAQDQPSGASMPWRGHGMMMWGGAEPGDYRNGPEMMGFGMMRGCPMTAATSESDYQRSASAWLDGQLAYIHSELEISQAQEAVWERYAAAIRDRTRQMLATHQSIMSSLWQKEIPFDQAYDLHIQVMQSHLEATKATRDAALNLFRALTPEQQQKATWVLPQSMCLM